LLKDAIKAREEIEDTVRPVADRVPTSWTAGVSYFLDAIAQREHQRFETCSTFDLADVRRHLAAIARVRKKLGNLPVATEDTVPPDQLSADAKMLHLARVLTPPGWRKDVRPALEALKQSVFDRFLAQRYEEPSDEVPPKKPGRPPKDAPKPQTVTLSDGDLQAEFQVYRDLIVQLDQTQKNGEMANARLLTQLPGRMQANGR